jgi:hypothetical protein
MTDALKEHFRKLDSLDFPHRKGPPEAGRIHAVSGPNMVRRVGTAVFALVIGVVSLGIAFRAFRTEGERPGAVLSTGTSTEPPTSHGPGVTVPDLVGLTDQQAMLKLNDLALRWLVAYRDLGDVEDGRVGSIDPVAGSRVDSGTRVRLTVATDVTPLPDGAADALDCQAEQRVAFGGPSDRVTPGGSAYIVSNLPGIERSDDVVQVSFEKEQWHGLWHVIRDGSVVAVVDYQSLDGEACEGSGVAGA